MSIKDVLLSLKILSKNNGLSEPYIVGGLPRDKLLDMSRKVEDVDLTTGDESIHKLAEVAVNEFKVEPTKFPDGHYQLIIDGTKYDFSSNFNSKDASFFLEKPNQPPRAASGIEGRKAANTVPAEKGREAGGRVLYGQLVDPARSCRSMQSMSHGSCSCSQH
jgi:hypothetical protein